MCLFRLFRRRKKKAEEVAKVEVKPEVEVKSEEAPVAVEVKEVKHAVVKPKVSETVKEDNGKVLVKVRYNRSYTA